MFPLAHSVLSNLQNLFYFRLSQHCNFCHLSLWLRNLLFYGGSFLIELFCLNRGSFPIIFLETAFDFSASSCFSICIFAPLLSQFHHPNRASVSVVPLFSAPVFLSFWYGNILQNIPWFYTHCFFVFPSARLKVGQYENFCSPSKANYSSHF